jgi:site-specific DNA-methyltransferase (adenine-specific)
MNLTIYNKDVSEGLIEIPTGTIDLVITSPPYWNLKDYNHPKQIGLNLTYKHYINELKKVFTECMRVIKEDSFICINVADIRTGKYKQSGRPRLYPIQSSLIQFFVEEMDFDLFQHFIWEKNSVKTEKKIHGSICTGEYKNYAVPPFLYNDLSIEHILIFRKPGIRKRASIEARQESKYNLLEKSLLQEWLKPVWKINSPRKGDHKATFPIEIVNRLIKTLSLQGDTVLDPFVGTGTTLLSAYRNQRNSIGYEINEDYLLNIVTELDLNKTNYGYCSANETNE